MKFRYDYPAVFIANLMDDCLDKDKILASLQALEKDCKKWGIRTEGKPIRQLLKELQEKETQK